MRTKQNKKRWSNATASYMNGDYENDPAGLLAAEIVISAISDWRALIKKKAWKKRTYTTSFAELRRFFESEWCDFLMQGVEIAPAAILDTLEAELREAIEKDEAKGGKE